MTISKSCLFFNRTDFNSSEFFFGKIRPILDTENDFETQNFEIFDKVAHNFGKAII